MQGATVIRRTPLTGGAEARTGRQTGRRSEALECRTAKKIEVYDAGCAKKIAALPVDFVSGDLIWVPRYLTIEDTEEICGRFGSFR